MRLCPFAAVVFTTLVLLHSGCDKKPEPEAGIPKGYGVLTVLVQDESGKPIVGAEVTIENSKAERFATKTGQDGRTKGAGLVSLNPFSVNVDFSGYEPQQRRGIALSESQRVMVLFILKRTKT